MAACFSALSFVSSDAPGVGSVRARGRYDGMKVEGARGELPLWTYDGTGSDYVDGRGNGAEDAGGDEAGLCFTPRLQDVDGDGSDEVVFVEQDFIFGRLLRTVRIEPPHGRTTHRTSFLMGTNRTGSRRWRRSAPLAS